jgi:hypothetical protein
MTANSEWLPRLPAIIADFEALSTMVLDREIFVHIFMVSRRQAIRLLHDFGAKQTDRGLAADRLQVLGQLRGMLDDYQIEQQRQARLAADLEKARRVAPARKVRIPTAPDVEYRTVATLPSAIQLAPGRLVIDFHGAEDLAAQLFELSQAMGNDWTGIVAAVEEPNHNLPAAASSRTPCAGDAESVGGVAKGAKQGTYIVDIPSQKPYN